MTNDTQELRALLAEHTDVMFSAMPLREIARRAFEIEQQIAKSVPAILDKIERLEAALDHIKSGEAFRVMRFAEDDEAEYFLRAQRNAMDRARFALEQQQ